MLLSCASSPQAPNTDAHGLTGGPSGLVGLTSSRGSPPESHGVSRPLSRPWHHRGPPCPCLFPMAALTGAALRAGERGPAESGLLGQWPPTVALGKGPSQCTSKEKPVSTIALVARSAQTQVRPRGWTAEAWGGGHLTLGEGQRARAGVGSCQLVSGCSGAGPEGLGGRGGRGGGVWRDVRPWAPRANCLRPLVSFRFPVYRVRLAWGSCSPFPRSPHLHPTPDSITASLPRAVAAREKDSPGQDIQSTVSLRTSSASGVFEALVGPGYSARLSQELARTGPVVRGLVRGSVSHRAAPGRVSGERTGAWCVCVLGGRCVLAVTRLGQAGKVSRRR